jgi:hypothetical protein
MRYHLSLLICILASISGLAYAQPEWATEIGMDFWNLPGLEADLQQSHRIAVELEQRSSQTLRRLLQKEAVVNDLLLGNCSFFEAAVQFKLLNRDAAHIHASYQLEHPNLSADEACCHGLIEQLRRHPRVVGDAERIRCFERELDALRAANNGTVHLPD